MTSRSTCVPRFRMWLGLFPAFVLFCLHPGVAAAACDITGPTEAATNQSFTLCGSSGNGYQYDWYGPGVPNNSHSRCITISGRDRGTYEYLLVVKVNGQEVDRCRDVV